MSKRPKYETPKCEVSDEDYQRLFRQLGEFTMATMGIKEKINSLEPKGLRGFLRHPLEWLEKLDEKERYEHQLQEMTDLNNLAKETLTGQTPKWFFDNYVSLSNWYYYRAQNVEQQIITLQEL